MAAKYILLALSAVFLILGVARMNRTDSSFSGAAKTWILIGGIFAVVSGWLFFVDR